MRTRRIQIAAAAVVGVISCGLAQADEIHVPGDWDTIQEAIFAATDGDEVIVADGVYTGLFNKNIDFGGLAITVRSENGPENCTIDCEMDGRGFQFRFGEGPDSIARGFTIVNGSAERGGGIWCDTGSSPTIDNCVFKGNVAGDGGGAYFISSATIVDCTFVGNSASDSGGGIASGDDGTLSISRCTFSGNVANGTGAGTGAAACMYEGLPHCRNAYFWETKRKTAEA